MRDLEHEFMADAATPPAPPAPPPEPDTTLELLLAPDDVAALARLPDVTRVGTSRPASLLWHDNAEAALAGSGAILQREGRRWRIQALDPAPGREWPACQPTPIVAEADTPGGLSPEPPFDAVPVAAFEGRRRHYQAGPVAIEVLHGELRGIVETRAACRLILTGPASSLATATQTLTKLRVGVPRAALAREALAVARGVPIPARHLGAPALDPDAPVGDGLAAVIAHLLDALLHWVDAFRRDPAPDAVHQGRVATRRLRSALSLYKRPAGCPALQDAGLALKECASRLGAARDWDVFLAGTGARLEKTSDDPRLTALLRAAKRRRDVVYTELLGFLGSPDFRRLELSLGTLPVLRPWETVHDKAGLERPTAPFAAETIERRHKHIRRRGRDLRALPTVELHELRKDCKRLRYAAEFFAPCFPAKPVKTFLKQLSVVQEELGLLNDGAVAAELMGQLGRVGGGYAGGVVAGWTQAEAVDARALAEKSWKRFRALDPFWKS